MSDQTIDKAINTYEAGAVIRYHTHPRLGRFTQNDAAHSWGVAALITQLHPDPSTKLLLAAILHDTGERFAGDLPAPVKAANPKMAADHAALEARIRADKIYGGAYELDDEDQAWLKMCDMLECCMFASLSVPEILKSTPWVSLIEATANLATKLWVQPRVDIIELVEAAYTRQGFGTTNETSDYSKYAETNS